MSSEQLSREFYRRLGAEGLAGRTQPEWDAAIVAAVVEMIPREARVLDVGCGYGRIALPLAREVYCVVGLDHSPELLASARRVAETEGLDITFTLGSMASLEYRNRSFDAVICLWSAFNELLEEEEQLMALREMWRVLKPGGLALIEEGPTPSRLTKRSRPASGVGQIGVWNGMSSMASSTRTTATTKRASHDSPRRSVSIGTRSRRSCGVAATGSSSACGESRPAHSCLALGAT